jgi:tetratricopeptide (TPR) repeat protein
MAMDHTRVDLGGGIAVELSHSIDRKIDEVGFDGVVAIATGLARLGLSAQAASLLEIGVPGASNRADGEFLGWVGRTFLEGHRVVDGVALSSLLLDEGVAPDAVIQAATALAETSRAPSVRDSSEVSDLLARCADTLVPQDQVAAEAWIRAAATARPHDPVKAIDFYQRAANANRDLGRSEPWLVAIGGAAHDADELDLAIASYRLALDRGQSIESYAALADSLLSAGLFAEAQRRFDEYHDHGGSDDRWLVSQILLGQLLDLGYASWEDAEAEFENRYLAEADEPGKPLSVPARRALNWFNSGVTALAAGRGDRALLCFLSAVTLMPMDDEAWVQATIGAFNSGNPELFARVIEAAYAQRTYMYLDMLRTMSAQMPTDYRGFLLDIVEEVAMGRAFPSAD